MRARCESCGFILDRCLCDQISPVFNKTSLIILQHPSEKKHALNTVVLMEKIFQKIHVFSGEEFSSDETLHSLLNQEKTALLFPDSEAVLIGSEASVNVTQLILLDGTWKKAKKIYYLNPFLHSLPKIVLKKEAPSLYRIRQSSFEESLSTLEATVSALSVIEPQLDCSSAINSFKRMIDFQIEKMGQDIFLKNYKNKKGDE